MRGNVPVRELPHVSVKLQPLLIPLLRALQLRRLVLPDTLDLDSLAEARKDEVLGSINDGLVRGHLRFNLGEVRGRRGHFGSEGRDGLLDDLELGLGVRQSLGSCVLRWDAGQDELIARRRGMGRTRSSWASLRDDSRRVMSMVRASSDPARGLFLWISANLAPSSVWRRRYPARPVVSTASILS